MKKKILLIFIFIAFFSLESFSQCAMCRATVGSNLSEGRGVIGTGINFGILYLLLTPYILIAGLIFMWYRTGKKELKEKLDLKTRLSEIYKK